jgi:peptidoglycan/LPS O-acetylase OafA/YrhL
MERNRYAAAALRETADMNTGGKAVKGGERFLALDSLRGLLACTVVIFHVRGDGYLWTLRYFQHGLLAVPFFFVLSGFVIGTTYGARLAQGFPIRRFLGLRLGRIYPLHLFMIVLLCSWEALRWLGHFGSARHGAPFTGLFDPKLLPYNLLLLQKFAGRLSWNDPSWSIGVEWWTYIMFAVLGAVLVIRRGLLLSAVILMLPGLIATVRHIDLGPGFRETAECMLDFGFGLLICELRATPPLWRHTDRIGTAVATVAEAIALALSIWMFDVFGGKFSDLVGPIFALTITVFSLERGWISRVLVLAPMLLLGELSYSIYMVHHFVLDRMLDLLWVAAPKLGLPVLVVNGNMALVGNRAMIDGFSLLVVAVAVGASYWTYRWVEKPARLWSRRVVNPNHSEKVTPRDPAAAF